MRENAGKTRRQIILATLGGTAAAIAGTCVPSIARASTSSAKWANLAPGFTALITDYVAAKELDKANGLSLGKPTSYTSVRTYYSDFIAGNYDVCIGSWDSFASRYLAKVPLRYACSITTANMINIVTQSKEVQTVADLAGRTLAAPQSTGTYRMMRALLKELEDLDLEKSVTVQNVDNPAAPITLVMANRANAGLSWEPNISVGMHRVPELRVIYNLGQQYRNKFGIDLPYFGVAIRQEALERDPDLAKRVDQTFAQCLSAIAADVDEAVQIAGANSGIPADVLRLAVSSGRLEFKHVSVSEESGRQSLRVAAEFLVRNGLLDKVFDDGFFAL